MKKTNINVDEVLIHLRETFESFDETRHEGLKTSAAIQEVKYNARLREKDRLVKKYGENHPKVKKLEANLSYGDSVKKGLDVEIERAGIKQPRFEPKSWRVTGLVLNSELKGVSNLTISLFNEDKEWIKDLGSTCTDDKGFFVLTVTDETGELIKRYAEKPLTLTITDSDQKILHQEKEPMHLDIGSIEYRQIILGEDQCPDPPPDSGDDDDETEPPDPTEKTWSVKGVVINKRTKRPMPGMLVRLSDIEKKFEKLLGEKVTNQKGLFEFIYDIKVLKVLLEANPDLFVMVFDKNGKKLYTSPEPFKCKPGVVEELEITV